MFSRTRSKSITRYITLIVRKGRNSWVPSQKLLYITAVRTSSSNKRGFEILGETSQCWEKAYRSDSRRDNSYKRIKSKRGSFAWHLLKLPKKTRICLSRSTKKGKSEVNKQQLNELEEFHWSERAKGPVNGTESMRAHKGTEADGKLVMSGGQIEVLIRGQSCGFLNKESRRWRLGGIVLSFITQTESDWICAFVTLDLC